MAGGMLLVIPNFPPSSVASGYPKPQYPVARHPICTSIMVIFPSQEECEEKYKKLSNPDTVSSRAI